MRKRENGRVDGNEMKWNRDQDQNSEMEQKQQRDRERESKVSLVKFRCFNNKHKYTLFIITNFFYHIQYVHKPSNRVDVGHVLISDEKQP